MSNKNARWGQSSQNLIVLAASAPMAHQMFGGKTLAQIGAEFDLADEDVKWGFGVNPNTQTEIKSLLLTVKGTTYQIPLSRGLKDEHTSNPDIMLNCMFRVTFKAALDADGNPKTDEKGDVVLDETAPYMSFGRPQGLTISRIEDVFEPVEEADPAKLVTGGAGQPAKSNKAAGAKK